ncbi:MAG: signal peptidase I [Verrucomicrobiota bacterium]|nr:signal peptidase I [Verrucomicrobiota bacterium]
MPYFLSWLLSKEVRQAADMTRHVQRLLHEQRDLLSAQAIDNIEKALAEIRLLLRSSPGKSAVKEQTAALETVGRANLRAYPFGVARENIKEIQVAITTILAFTTFFLQLTKIPTGSMQPTLFGITEEDIRNRPDVKIPGFLGQMADYWVHGVSYKHLVAPTDGMIERIEDAKLVVPFVKKQRFLFAGQWITVWFPADQMFARAGVGTGQRFKKGEDILKLRVVAGDHLLVDRFSYNFKRPERGEIIVFKTKGIENLQQDVLYIKRLVGLPNETVRILDNGHLMINGTELTASTRRFESLYTYSPPGTRFPYLGHANNLVGLKYSGRLGHAPIFADENSEFKVRDDHYLAMGDNTLNSLDSRSWGDFSQKNVIGRCWFVYWPITERFGWGYR